ncbi:Nif3-like dinuclear metal center hexameric protein [Mucilaginibacter sp.]|uniref:Nif3-like dinuclear metal center hexameric protein n=1 Tax=Mucilaginibacter sp. TaxID=1882438 RepID=UPI003D0B35E5
MDPLSNLPGKPVGNRRKFIINSAKTAGVLLAMPVMSKAGNFISINENYTVGQIMDLFINSVPGGAITKTVDTLKSGSRDTVVTGIVMTMFATIEVIRKTIELGANFIIAHEPTFYNHADDTTWLKNDEVYKYKADLLKQHNIAVWRNHDYIHTLVPDGVMTGVLKQMDWEKYADKAIPNIITLPPTSLKNLISYTKSKLHIDKVRYIGDPEQVCKRVLFMEGSPGGHAEIEDVTTTKPDVLICGEISEWEIAEYVRDARAKGDSLALVVTGHIASEEPGSEFMLGWLMQHVPSVKVTHILSGNSLSFL